MHGRLHFAAAAVAITQPAASRMLAEFDSRDFSIERMRDVKGMLCGASRAWIMQQRGAPILLTVACLSQGEDTAPMSERNA